jgi:aldose 1-epimerase
MFISEHRKLRQPGTAEAPGEEELTSVYLAGPDETIEAEICPEIGCTCFSLRYGGRELLHFPFNLNHYRASEDLAGIPILYPWANRLEEDWFPFRGKKYELSGPVYRDGNGLPIHGLILKSHSWSLKDLNASSGFARALFEFNLEVDGIMRSNFPFNHSLFLTFELRPDALTVLLEIENRDRNAFPVSPGFHPYFSLGSHARNDVRLSIPARDCMTLDERYIPTGKTQSVKDLWPNHMDIPLGSQKFDTVFSDLISETAAFKLIRPDVTVEVLPGKDYPVGIVYAPPEHSYVCMEPMAGPTNGFFLLDRGQYKLPVLEPGDKKSLEYTIKLSETPDS